jgi:metal-responsive CopG/Arc/MetJ family transcriptional regulator
VKPQLSVTVGEKDVERIDAWAQAEEVSRSELLRTVIKQALAERQPERRMPVVLPEVAA